jgi:phage FluMu gp28-like protein
MQTLTLVLPKLHSSQRAVVREASRYNVLACGRRWGKSTLAIELAMRPMLAGSPVGYFTPNYKLLLEFWRQIVRLLAPVTRRSNVTDRRIELVTGGILECWTLESGNAGRSRRYQRVIIDEAGLSPSLGETWQAAIRPTLADLSGDAWLMGTPKGRNFFWTAFQRALSGGEWRCWQRPTRDNPFIAPPEIEAMREEMTERRYAQEIEAQFLDDGGGVFRNVRACVRPSVADPLPDHQYVIGADWGRTQDYSVFAVVDLHTRACVALDRSNQVDYTVQHQRLRALHERWNGAQILAEQNSIGQPILENLQRDKLPVRGFMTTNATKAAIVEGLALAFERKTIGIPDDPILIGELEAFESERLPSGLTRYRAPENMHDDTVIALALAWEAAAHRVTNAPWEG